MNILIVDDDPVVIKSCSRILLEDGHETCTADSVEAGEKELSRTVFDLMITDIKMPGQDGFEMARRARKLHPDMPILMMTGYLMPETVNDIRRLGVTHFIAKPFTPSELMEAVEDATRNDI